MKQIKYIVLLLFILTMVNAKAPQEKVITKSFAAEKGGTLKIKLNPGEIHIKTWERNEVLLKIDGLDEDESDELELSERQGNVTVEYDGKWGWGKDADYHFTIPNQYSVEIYTTGGDISIQNDIGGDLTVQTMGGDISLRSISGNTSIETMGGDIELVDVGGSSYISTQGGDINIGNLKGGTKEVKTMGGDIKINSVNEVRKITTYGGDIEINNAAENLEVTTFGGNIKLNNCEAGVIADTYGGNIFIQKAEGLVNATTGGGNITLQNITGAVKARTGAGDIRVELKTDGSRESDIRTSAGDIEFTVLPGAKMTIRAEVDSYWGKESTMIQSDFEGTVGKNRNDINGTYNINGGGVEVELRATNGRIKINKK